MGLSGHHDRITDPPSGDVRQLDPGNLTPDHPDERGRSSHALSPAGRPTVTEESRASGAEAAVVRKLSLAVTDPGGADEPSFRVLPDGRVEAIDTLTRELAETALYVSQLAELMGRGLGAGALSAMEVLGLDVVRVRAVPGADGTTLVGEVEGSDGPPPAPRRPRSSARVRGRRDDVLARMRPVRDVPGVVGTYLADPDGQVLIGDLPVDLGPDVLTDVARRAETVLAAVALPLPGTEQVALRFAALVVSAGRVGDNVLVTFGDADVRTSVVRTATRVCAPYLAAVAEPLTDSAPGPRAERDASPGVWA
jgi:hypothetical protein